MYCFRLHAKVISAWSIDYTNLSNMYYEIWNSQCMSFMCTSPKGIIYHYSLRVVLHYLTISVYNYVQVQGGIKFSSLCILVQIHTLSIVPFSYLQSYPSRLVTCVYTYINIHTYMYVSYHAWYNISCLDPNYKQYNIDAYIKYARTLWVQICEDYQKMMENATKW